MVFKKPQLNFRRFEFKYILPTKLADFIIGSISNFVIPDPLTLQKDHYSVNSIYFDSPNLLCYQQKENGIKNRKKYRIRYYGKNHQKTSSLIFFEIKRKIDSVIIKNRVVINKKQMKTISQKNWHNIAIKHPTFFSELYIDFKKLRLKPLLFVQYKRKPFFSRYNKNFRITFDFDIKASKITNVNNKTHYIKNIHHQNTIMEIKFNGTIPPWFAYTIKSNNLKRSSFSKYCNSLQKTYNLH